MVGGGEGEWHCLTHMRSHTQECVFSHTYVFICSHKHAHILITMASSMLLDTSIRISISAWTPAWIPLHRAAWPHRSLEFFSSLRFGALLYCQQPKQNSPKQNSPLWSYFQDWDFWPLSPFPCNSFLELCLLLYVSEDLLCQVVGSKFGLCYSIKSTEVGIL